MMHRRLVVFVGCQGAGKTTQAFLLLKALKSLKYDAYMISLADYVIFQQKFINLLKQLCKTNVVIVKFYEDLPPGLSPSPEIYRRLFMLLIFLHFVGFTISLIKKRLFMLLCQVVIEHEGYVFKQLADIYFLVAFAKVKPNSVISTLLKRFSIILLSTLLKDKILIIHLRADVNILKKRYAKRLHVEPAHYLHFQEKVYSRLIEYLANSHNIDIVNVNSDLEVAKVYSTIANAVYAFLRR